MSSRASRTLYVGNLPADIREREVEDLFYKVTWLYCNSLDWLGCDMCFAFRITGLKIDT